MGQVKKCSKCKEEINIDAKKCKHCGADLRNWFVRHKILTAILIIIVLSIITSAMSGENSTNNNTLTDQKTSEESTNNEPTKPKEWQKVVEMTTNANKQGETFYLEGGQQKVIYTTTGGSMTLCSIYVMDEGSSLDENGGFPVVMVDGASSDETMMRKGRGAYYLDVKAVNGTCSVEIQEYK